ncbi:MAG TPA: single-stranded-DNA-specific exonuclease RecJ [Rhizomicrobium sp.]|jgi:single-stranded-DNA-specific exonuclease|nr:single-stranded-DNA-specific exonuclease RecJ [Rhizomicrobium sp.]
MWADAYASPHEPAFEIAHSFSGRRWRLPAIDNAAVRALSTQAEISLLLARLLAARGVSANEARDYLNPTIKRLLPEPRLFKDMEKAVARVQAAIVACENIAVFGDYDVDGSCSAAMMRDFLTAIGHKPRIYIPDRMTEGYGPSAAALLKLKDEGISLVITVDCGATATAALTAAHDAGLDVIVLDHHAVETLPPVFAQVNPNQPGDKSGMNYLCAAGVTFLFLVALSRALRESFWYAKNFVVEPDMMGALDLAGLATICDVVPLIGLNRAFARGGLARLAMLKRKGFAALARVANAEPPFTTHHLGFVFGPRINAGGRVGRCSLGVELLTGLTEEECNEAALQLDLHNRERQAIEQIILEDAIAMASTQANAPFVLVAKDGWHPGVVGIVAGRLRERFGKPAFVAGFEGGMGRGSVRSVPGVDVGAAVREAAQAGVIDSGGGHAMAAGFSIYESQLDGFVQFLAARFAETGGIVTVDVDLDLMVSPRGATQQLAEEIALGGPYGAGNPEPMLVVPDARLVFADVVGKNHIRFRLAGHDGARLDGIAFRAVETKLGEGLLKARGQLIHAAGKLRAEEWQGRVRVQLHLEDAASAQA